MSIYGALYSGVSGLFAQSQALGTISDNISNVNTVGYKATSDTFSTLVTEAATSTSYTPGGVIAHPRQLIDHQGLLQSASSPTDIAVSGNGFFVVNTSAASQSGTPFLFTRAGDFQPDANGNLVNTAGYYLQGFPTDASGNIITTNRTTTTGLETVNVQGLSGTAAATQNITVAANLPATDAAGTVHDITAQIYDSLGVAHNLTLEFTKAATLNEWTVAAPSLTLASSGAASGTVTFGPSVVTFNTDGTLNTVSNPSNLLSTPEASASAAFSGYTTIPAASNTFDILDNNGNNLGTVTYDNTDSLNTIAAKITAAAPSVAATVVPNGVNFQLQVTSATHPLLSLGNDTGNFITQLGITDTPSAANPEVVQLSSFSTGAANDNITLNLGTSGKSDGLSQFSNNFALSSVSQDGRQFGNLSGISIDETGLVVATFTNGQTRPFSKIPLATFPGTDYLKAVTGNAYQATAQSGNFLLQDAGSGNAGTVQSGALEQSTVDLANEFSNMIVTQRAYSASARVITTADQMLQVLDQIGR
jgi:flagellar hook protein FlgE